MSSRYVRMPFSTTSDPLGYPPRGAGPPSHSTLRNVKTLSRLQAPGSNLGDFPGSQTNGYEKRSYDDDGGRHVVTRTYVTKLRRNRLFNGNPIDWIGAKELLFTVNAPRLAMHHPQYTILMGFSKVNHWLRERSGQDTYGNFETADKVHHDIRFTGVQQSDTANWPSIGAKEDVAITVFISHRARLPNIWRIAGTKIAVGAHLYLLWQRFRFKPESDKVMQEVEDDADRDGRPARRRRGAGDEDAFEVEAKADVQSDGDGEDGQPRRRKRRLISTPEELQENGPVQQKHYWQLVPWVSTDRREPPEHLYINHKATKNRPRYVGDKIFVGRVSDFYGQPSENPKVYNPALKAIVFPEKNQFPEMTRDALKSVSEVEIQIQCR